MHVEDLMELGIVDAMIEEPLGGAHNNPPEVYNRVKEFISEQWNILKRMPMDCLLEQRYQKFRRMGRFVHAEKEVD